MVETILIFLLVGVFVGLLAGLLGVGGGIIIVPVLVYILPAIGLPENNIMQVALGTSVTCTFFSMLSSAFRHYKNGSIKFNIFSKLVFGLIIGGVLGPIIAHVLNYTTLKNIFALLLFLASLRMLISSKNSKIKSDNSDDEAVRYNGIIFLFLAGMIVGTLASLMGIGGGILLMPLLSFMNVRMNEAVGTSAISGVTIGFIAIFGYAISGYHQVSDSDLYIGYIYLPAVIGISLTSIIFAQIGALWSKDVSQDILKKLLSCILIFTAGKMFF